MPRLMSRIDLAFLLRLTCAAVCGASLALAQAAELGDVVVKSHTGQPLIADIELITLADPGQAVGVRIAHPDVFKGANIGMHPVLANLTMSVMRRDGRQFLHITSTKAVDSDYVHLFLDLNDGGRRNVRAATLFLTPDPAPAPPPRPVVAAPVVPVAPLPLPAPIPAQIPAPISAPMPAPIRKILDKPAAACPAPVAPAPDSTCSSIAYQNGLLSAQIVELEEKVKQLELAMRSKGMALPGDVAPIAAAVPAPAAQAPAVPPPPPKRSAIKPVESAFPWLLVIAIVAGLIATGAGVWFFLRRRKAIAGAVVEAEAVDAGAATPAEEGGKQAWYKKLLGRFKRKPEVAPEPAAEPGASS